MEKHSRLNWRQLIRIDYLFSVPRTEQLFLARPGVFCWHLASKNSKHIYLMSTDKFAIFGFVLLKLLYQETKDASPAPDTNMHHNVAAIGTSSKLGMHGNESKRPVPKSATGTYVLREAHRLLRASANREDSTGSLTDSAPVRNIEIFVTGAPLRAFFGDHHGHLLVF
jgi:hypothetical protein